MSTETQLPEPVIRPEFINENIADAHTGEVARELSAIEKFWNINGVRKITILLGLVVTWQAYTVLMDVQPLMFPPFLDAAARLWQDLIHGDLSGKVWFSIKVLIYGDRRRARALGHVVAPWR